MQDGNNDKEYRVACHCEPGRCFLEEDGIWTQRNHEAAKRSGEPFPCRMTLYALDLARLQKKSDWITSLGVAGTRHIRCRMESDEARL
ncbi:MAG: hypothetical protein HZB71_09655 [Betaproteobacteria bacterium]|nr:hypothetical protein [Betaproteobacteria bacterium]